MHSTKGMFIGLILLLGLLVAMVSFGAPMPKNSTPSPVIYFDNAKVAEALAKGAVISEGVPFGPRNYRVFVNSMHFEKPEAPELHKLTTHIIYVLDGTGNVVTGGTLINSKTTAPNETRGSAIEGGEVRRLSKGDVIVIPNGVPHRYTEAQSGIPFVVLIINVRSASGK